MNRKRSTCPRDRGNLIVDGGKGLRAAVRKAFRHRALVQRCQWHKREVCVPLGEGHAATDSTMTSDRTCTRPSGRCLKDYRRRGFSDRIVVAVAADAAWPPTAGRYLNDADWRLPEPAAVVMVTLNAPMTPYEFIGKWRASALKERSAS